jgi:hypothetical protein
MPQQESRKDCHLRRVAADADRWSNWLERLAEIRRENERDEPLCAASLRLRASPRRTSAHCAAPR